MKIETKYEYGQIVNCHGIEGMITAIFIRDSETYEFSYVNNDGILTCVNVNECEISTEPIKITGFNKNGKT